MGTGLSTAKEWFPPSRNQLATGLPHTRLNQGGRLRSPRIPPPRTIGTAIALRRSRGQSATEFNWYPINFYDAREGEPRDTQYNNDTCTANGVMNVVELDVGNLAKWLNGTIAGNGTKVDYQAQNGYVLYFSDRRGMLPNPNGTQLPGTANTKTGDSGLEDSVNRASAAGTPDGVLDPDPPGKQFSDEDVNLNGTLENFGANNMGLGMGY